MQQPQQSAQQSQRNAIKSVISALGTSKVLSQIKNNEILTYLTASGGLKNFLFQISSRQLFEVANQKQQQQQEQERASRYRINVLDLAVHELVKHCRNYGLLKYGIVQGNHHTFGMMLVRSVPDKFYVGSKSQHYNRAQQIQRQYGIVNHQQSSDSESEPQPEVDEDEDEGNRDRDDANQQYVRDHYNQQQQERQDQGLQEQLELQQNESSQFINDEVQESDYQQSQEQVYLQEQEQSQQHQAPKRNKSKQKKIIKQRTQRNKKILGSKKKEKNQRIIGTRKSSRFAYKGSSQQQEIYLQDYQIQLPNSQGNKSKQKNTTKNSSIKQNLKNLQEQQTDIKKNKKKLSLDSD